MTLQADKAREGRPDPDALLAAAGQEGRGRLKIFVGAAPGVGKTYAMLSAARQLTREGVPVVVGLVETHGRAETQALLDGLDILPRRSVLYQGREVEEFDLDGALALHPPLLIVDELAHTNAPDSRHPKRYQDVAELLRAGIDVWTAVNIQHLESLSDVVSTITGVAVRETIPDTVLEKADEVVVVDITPSELLTRLKEGKVYLPDNARRAADNFFKLGNLTALRELALRRTADRVDDQMVAYLRQNAIEGAWPTAERLLVCVGSDGFSEAVVRSASRLANGLNAGWVAVTLERAGAEISDEAALRRIDETMRLAERLGAEAARLVGRDLPDELLRYARRENITQIVIGRSGAGLWGRLRGRALSDQLVRRATDIAIHVVVGEGRSPARQIRWPEQRKAVYGVLLALGSVTMAVLVGLFVRRHLQLPNLSMIFLAAVLVCAVSIGVWPAILAAILSFLAYNFFFIPPLYTFTVAEPHEFFALLIFLLVAVLTGGLAGRVRDQSNAARKRVATIQTLYDVARKLSATASLDDVLWIVARQGAASVKGQVVILLPNAVDDLEIRAAFPPEDTLGTSEDAAARWAFRNGEVAGWRSGTLPNAQFQFQPLRTSRGTLGVVGFQPADRSVPLGGDDERALAALLDQAAVAIERTQLVAEARDSEAKAETERLRTALLSSISHDLRTPLSSIIGSITTLRRYGDRMPDSDKADLLEAIEEEASRLGRFVSNLLDMTRLEAGTLDLRRDWVDVSDAARAATERAERAFPHRRVELKMPSDLPLVRGDAALLQQVVFNLLDNADKFTDGGTPTTVEIALKADWIEIAVEDEGPGIPPDALQRVFEKFVRLSGADGRPAGTGLGLAIAKGVVEAMGGTIEAISPVATNPATDAPIGTRHRDPPPSRRRSRIGFAGRRIGTAAEVEAFDQAPLHHPLESDGRFNGLRG